MARSGPRQALATTAAGAFCGSIGIAVLIGWHAGLPAVVRVGPHFRPMPYASAVGFVLVGASLLAWSLGQRTVVRVLGVVLLGVATAAGLGHAFGCGGNPEVLLQHSGMGIGHFYSGCVPPTAILDFVLTAVALQLVTTARPPHQAIALLGSVVTGVGATSLLGYAINVNAAGEWNGLAPMALHGAAAFVLIGLALVNIAWRQATAASDERPAWLSIPVGVAVTTTSVVLWEALLEVGVPLPLGTTTLAIGLTAAVLIGLAVHFAQRARHGLRRAEQVTRRLEAEIADRRRAEERLQAIFNHAGVGIVEVDENLRLVAVNDRMCEIVGHSREELLTMTAHDLTAPEDRRYSDELSARLRDGLCDRFETDKRYLMPDGSRSWVHVTASAIRGADERFHRAIATVLDISGRKAAEDRIRASLEEKEVLLREVHHRVKNNLAVISSLFYLQSTDSEDPRVVTIFQQSQDRVRSMALVHESLYRSTNLSAVEFSGYVRGLAEHLLTTYQPMTGPVRLRMEMAPIDLTIEQAIPCGLVINELITNALKHAFHVDWAGELTISGRSSGDGRCEIQVRDNGVGLPDAVDVRDARTLGLRLVRSLATQLDAEISVRRTEPGTEARLVFSIARRRTRVAPPVN